MRKILFSREYSLSNDETLEVRIREPEESAGDWICKHEIQYSDGVRRYETMGIDKLQALLLCLSATEAQLENYASSKKQTIAWMGDKRLGLIWADWQRE